MENFLSMAAQIQETYLKGLALLVGSMLQLLLMVLPFRATHIKYYEEVTQQTKSISLDKTILALDFDRILLQHSRYCKPMMVKLQAVVQKTWFQRLMFWKDVGYFYKTRPGYVQFVKQLAKIPNATLFLYTKQHNDIADRLLEELGISSYIQPQNRRYNSSCKTFNNMTMKHPAYVDPHTQRVVILTENVQFDCDDSNESSRYFLEIPYEQNAENLMKWASLLQYVITHITNQQNLHEQLQTKVILWQHQGKL